jgi:DNA polymerase-3 subunit delta'
MSETASLYPWQSDAWMRLQQMQARLPHAILFQGPPGIGKLALAEQFAQSLLCEAPSATGTACGGCPSCGWFAQYSHPDYRRIRPEALEESPSDDETGEDGDAKKTGKSSKAPSREIKIEQVRHLGDWINVSTHRQGKRVVLLYPAEALNTASANAILKTLEEPPAETVFLLVSHSAESLLPTILSRCHRFPLAIPSQEMALAWLKESGIADAEAWLAEQGGAPLLAYEMAQAESRETLDAFLSQLVQPGREAALKLAAQLQKTSAVDLVVWLQRWLNDLFSVKLAGRVRYYPRYHKQLAALATRTDVAALQRMVKALNERRAIAEHPLSARLFIEDMLLEYSALFHKG